MSPSINDLGLSNEKLDGAGASFADMPDEYGGAAPPPPPGSYRFQLPKSLAELWAKLDAESTNNHGERVSCNFDEHNPLIIVQSPASASDGEPFQVRLNNVPRRRGPKTAQVEASDLDYLLRAFGETARPSTNRGYITAMQKYASKTFGADIEWSWYCNKKKPIYVEGEDGVTKPVENTLGCGTTYYQNDVAKVEGAYPLRVTCQCGAGVRAFGNLRRFKG